MRIRAIGTLVAAGLGLAGLSLAACQSDQGAFYPETASADRVLEQRALERVPARYEPTGVTVIKQWGAPQPGADTDIVGYDAWIRVEGCKGHVLVRFNRWGDYLTTGDMTECQ
ncbi:hypothetical protein GCM10017083_00560 [Thalassobaculum fulvum]|uniref:Lipoprotein n=1 Tax=Thalassobaculum fulvum TaxID=1633335 RepID=A0A918XN35_9PROT|nr:hypothetical protein [Thalassobaculum fulvum]GHD39092.1 hypothetical protein GCM10017083_00560 [Thalassobaculum fulvum]